ncbi:structural protein [Pseudomonas mosselii]|uniref:structural protein n=1 Tax=Pseudomonas mosselii TaxID=78327 RepID=UPI000BB45C0A|nr:structural protein [Pseudomonas mosselii]ATB63284.1 structural protein [Pseudomonas mosselii]MDH1101085.1 structural protein [Pseudomonas mosselii]
MIQSLPRGVRNCNPGNIDFNPANNWVGQIGKESGGRFCVFDTPENGIRALGKLLQTYYYKHGLRTVAAIIKRWAPEVENDTDAYTRTVAQRCGLAPSDPIQDIKNLQVLGGLVHAIIRHENANYEYPAAVFSEGLRRALG